MDLTARVQGTFYTRCALPLDEGGLREIDNATYAFADGEIDASSHVYSQEMLTEYRKGIGRGIVYALNPGFNYIYKIDRPLRLFEKKQEDLLYALKQGMIDLEALSKLHPGKTPEAALASLDMDSIRFLRIFKKGPFTKYYDGVVLDDVSKARYWGHIGVWLSIVVTSADLVDGNVKRFVKEAPSATPEIPKEIVEELVEYTAKAGGRIGTAAKKWLQENIKPPYGSIKVYRGVKLEGYSVAELTKEAQAYLGLKGVLDLHKGTEITLSRGRASSWSQTPQISREFANSGTVHILTQAELKPKQIIVDLTLLPLSIRQRFRHFSQNEVIAAPGKISARIINIGVSDYLLKDIETPNKTSDPAWQDYAWMPRYGFIQRKASLERRVVARYLSSI